MTKHKFIGLCVALAVMAIGVWLTTISSFNNRAFLQAQFEARLAADFINPTIAGDNSQVAFDKLHDIVPSLRACAALSGMKYLYNDEPEKIGERLNPKDLSDKAMYDRFRKIKHQWGKEGEAAEVIEIERNFLRQPRMLYATFPLHQDGSLKGAVFCRVFIPPHRQWLTPVLTALGLALAGAALLFVLKGRRQDAVNIVLLFLFSVFCLIWPPRESTGYDIQDQKKNAEYMEQLIDLSVNSEELADHYRSSGIITKLTAAQKTVSPDLPELPYWFRFFGLISGAAVYYAFRQGRVRAAFAALRKHRLAYTYISPAMIGMFVLVFLPLSYGVVLAFLKMKRDTVEFVGVDNFIAILTNLNVTQPDNFYFTLGVTILWTAANVILHVSIGLALALILNHPRLHFKGVYRVLLILPWAIPNYITALIWKGMFHKQFGAINAFLEFVGMESISWFNSFGTAFLANLTTNVWLGFPFMMVASLGALQAIPEELYEAASIDGATKKQQFLHITIPFLKSALFPAIILGSIWTFNMFNIIYLVSGGAPAGATDILIVDAYRWAFQKYNYGYAAAYSIVIFIVLYTYSKMINRITKATEGAFD